MNNPTKPNQSALECKRKQRGWTREYVAEKVGVMPLTVGRWERGEQTPQPGFVQGLCNLFDLTPKELGLIGEGVRSTPTEGPSVEMPFQASELVGAETDSTQHPSQDKIYPPLPTRKVGRTALGLVSVVLVLGLIAFFVFRSTLSTPDQTTLSQTLDTFCKAMIAGNTDVASAQFTTRGLQDFNPVERKSYISCKYDQLKMLPDKAALGHLEVVTIEKVTYSIGVTLVWDGTSWKINRWLSRELVPKTRALFQSHFDHLM